jgi:hypothetical protein
MFNDVRHTYYILHWVQVCIDELPQEPAAIGPTGVDMDVHPLPSAFTCGMNMVQYKYGHGHGDTQSTQTRLWHTISAVRNWPDLWLRACFGLSTSGYLDTITTEDTEATIVTCVT